MPPKRRSRKLESGPEPEEAPATPVARPAAAQQLPSGLINPNEDLILSSDGDDSEIMLFPDSDGDSLDEHGNKKVRAVDVGNWQELDDETDSSEDEAPLNRVGDIPFEWYQDEDHIGYDIDGRKLLKPKQSALDKLLEATDDPNALRTIIDDLHGEKRVLTNEDLEVIFNLQRNRTANSAYDMYADYPESRVKFDPLNHPLARGTGPSKKKFVPALHEMKRLRKLVKKILAEKEAKRLRGEDDKEEEKKDEPFILWDDSKPPEMDTHTKFKYINKVPKPAMPPPGTYESYRPPPEYLPSAKNKEKFSRLRKIDRKEHFLPQAFQALRHVPFYHHTIQDRYQRCLDLSQFPRMQRTRLVVDPDKLLPELPDPKDLRPYPERLSFIYRGHTAIVRSISVSPNGQYLATGCDDHMVRIFEVQTGRLMKRYDVHGVIQELLFCPNPALNILAVAVDYTLLFIVAPFCAHPAINDHSIRFLKAPGMMPTASGTHVVGGAQSATGGITQTTTDKDETAYEGGRDLHDELEREKRAEFVDGSATERNAGIMVKIMLHARIKKFCFHAKGDYLCAICPKDHVKYRQTVMLQLSRRKVFCPFRKFADVVTDCKFHPTEPQFFLSTTNAVRCYNLLAHRLQKKFKAHGGLTTCLDVHPEGDNFLIGDTTSHTSWFDTDFSNKPYKRMRSHKSVVNAVAFHPKCEAYPLFASAAADGQTHIFHGKVSDDYNTNALIVPVKILKHQRPVYSIAWHPTLPWLFTSTEDGTVSCWTE